MRDLIIVGLVVIGSLIALRRPWVGIMVWTWLSIMNPHRFAWGFAYDFPVAALSAACTLVGFMATKDKSNPVKGAPVAWLLVFMAWVTLSWLMGLDPKADYPQWDKVMKIYLMVIVGLALLHTKEHILLLVWVSAGSLALLGIKSGIVMINDSANSLLSWMKLPGGPQTR